MANKGPTVILPEPDMRKIFDSVLLSAQPSIKIPLVGIGGEASKIEIVLCGICDIASTNDVIDLSYNNDVTDANYRYGQHRSSSASHASSNADGRRIGIASGATATRTTASGLNLITIPDPFNRFFEKNAYCNSMVRFATDAEIWHFSHQWENNAPIELITLTPGSSNFIRGTRCTVYLYT